MSIRLSMHKLVMYHQVNLSMPCLRENALVCLDRKLLHRDWAVAHAACCRKLHKLKIFKLQNALSSSSIIHNQLFDYMMQILYRAKGENGRFKSRIGSCTVAPVDCLHQLLPRYLAASAALDQVAQYAGSKSKSSPSQLSHLLLCSSNA